MIDDKRKQKGRFILTGSSSPELLKNVSESLAGRIGIVELEPFKMNELFQEKLPDFYSIFEESLSSDNLGFLKGLKPSRNAQKVKQAFLKGGYPEPVLEGEDEFYHLWMENYHQTYINRDIRTLFPKLDITRYRRFISMLSHLSGTILNKADLARSLNLSEPSVADYLDIANGSFIWRKIPSYENSHTKSILKMPKGNLRDIGFLNYLQGVNSSAEQDTHPRVGHSFESFVTEELIRGVNATSARNVSAQYFRTRNGAEVDLILIGSFGVLPIEVKYGVQVKQNQLRSLKDFIEKQNLPFGVVVNNADKVELLAEKIVQIPVSMI